MPNLPVVQGNADHGEHVINGYIHAVYHRKKIDYEDRFDFTKPIDLEDYEDLPDEWIALDF